ncbi:putative neprosin activation peptide, leucine-rich repeat domain superfamily [Helianthus annuus]|nr:putative neprosin activation peptide, leucine-rich repeat domain superfamily [Helianthus annuus]
MVTAHVSRNMFNIGFLLFFVLFLDLALLSCARQQPASRQKLQVHKHLKRLNKKPVKSIESPDGDIIDCVHISHQPAFDHPFLKDHKIQMRPNYHPEGLYDETKMNTESKQRENSIHQLWQVNGMCPEDTIPIRRTKEEDVLRASSVKMHGRKKHKSIAVPRSVPKSADPDIDNESGRIPSGTQLQTFEPTRYTGNTGLCGPPLAKYCPRDKELEVAPFVYGSEGEGEDDIRIWFYFGGGTGFETGFWIACGALLVNRRGRKAFSRFLDISKDWVTQDDFGNPFQEGLFQQTLVLVGL